MLCDPRRHLTRDERRALLRAKCRGDQLDVRLSSHLKECKGCRNKLFDEDLDLLVPAMKRVADWTLFLVVYENCLSMLVREAQRFWSQGAEDVAVEVLYEVWPCLEKYDPERCSLAGYLVVKARSRALRARETARRRQNRGKSEAAGTTALMKFLARRRRAEEVPVERNLERREFWDAVWESQGILTKKEREVFRRRFKELMEYLEIAEALGITESRARAYATEACAKMFPVLKRKGFM